FFVLTPRVTETFGYVSSSLSDGYGGGGGQPETYASAPPMEAPLPSADGITDFSKSAVLNAPAPQAQERKVIKNNQLPLVAKNPEKSRKNISALAEQLGGYVVSSNLYQTTYGPNNTPIPQAQVVIRVPATKLTDAVNQIKQGAVEVQSENLTGQDV